MDSLQKENDLLKGFVASLEKQNSARNAQRTTLYQEIDRLTDEVDRLNALKSNSRVVTTSNSDKQIKILKETITSLTKDLDSLKGSNAQLTNDLRSKTNQIVILTQEQQRLTIELKSLRQSSSSSSNNRILLLESEINSYKIKISQITIIEQKLRASNTRIVELEASNRKFETDYKRVENDFKRQETELRRLENQNKELKLNNRSSIQISSLLSSKLSLEATIRQLNGKVQWLESNSKNSDQEKLSLEKRIKDLEKEILDAKGKLTQFRFNQEALKSAEANLSIKDKQMEALEQMIGSLKDNKKYLEELLRKKQDAIANLEAQISHNKVNHADHLQRQLDELVAGNHNLEKQLSFQIKSNEELQGELRMLRGERDKFQRDISILTSSLDEAHREIKVLKTKVTEHTTVTTHEPYFKPVPVMLERNVQNDDLRLMVSCLKDQLEELKASQQFKSQLISNNPHHCDSCHHLHLKNHLQRQSRSPNKVQHSKVVVNNERDQGPYVKSKWDNLQRKINALRNENETLKKSLFE